MSYYPTIEEDLARAKQILEKGKNDVSLVQNMGGEAVYASDIYAAYKLLESFVAEIERLRNVGRCTRCGEMHSVHVDCNSDVGR